MKSRHKAENEASAAPGQPGEDGQEPVVKDLNELIAAMQHASHERDQLKDQLLRTMADFQNFRKRQEDQRKQLEQFATERLVASLLPVLDNFERALTAFGAGATIESTMDGLGAVDRQFRQVLEGQNVRRIPSVGHAFNPEVHEALAIETSEEHDDNTIIGELEAGYKMGEKVIRPARVRVARKAPKE